MVELIGGMLNSIMSKEGVIFAMFAALLVWVMYTNDKRETRYISTIDNLANNVGSLDTRVSKIEGNVQDIKTAVFSSKI